MTTAKIYDYPTDKIGTAPDVDAALASRPSVRKVRPAPDDWKKRLTRNEKLAIRSTTANATLILSHDPAWDGVLGFDERAEEPVFLRPPPFHDCPAHIRAAPRALRDSDDVWTAQWLEQVHGVTIPVTQIGAVVNAVASATPFDQVREYLEGVRWDLVPRLDRWLSDYLGAPVSPYIAAVGRRWMISAVARTFRPGCKVDHVLVLEGEQGSGKSSALRALAGEEHFGDDIPAIGSKDCQQYLGGFWIVELAEMDAATRAEAATLKRFLTTPIDSYRPSYGKRTIRHTRRCVFAGTVNLEEYLRDPTGGRRFWPVACTKVALEALRADRDQLWAEAVHAYRAGEPWHLSEPELLAAAATEQAQRLEHDPWEDAVATWLDRSGRAFVTVAEVLEHAIGIDLPRVGRPERTRAAAVMRAIGWRYGEGGSRQRGFHRP